MVALTEQIIKGKTRIDKLEHVKNLNLWGQDLDDVSVLAKLPNVQVLSLSVNRISSLREFSHCSKLQELYLRKNDVSDLNELGYLAGLKDLRVLWLSDNPCAEHPKYKAAVARVLPHLHKLDNDEMDAITREFAAARRVPSAPSVLAPAPAQQSVQAQNNNINSSSSPYSQASNSSSSSPYAGGGANLPRQTRRDGLVSRGSYRDRSAGGGIAGEFLPDVGSTPLPAAAYAPPPPPLPSHQHQQQGGGGAWPGSQDGRGVGMMTFGRTSRKNVLYAVMALLGELEDDDLVYVQREIEQRLRM